MKTQFFKARGISVLTVTLFGMTMANSAPPNTQPKTSGPTIEANATPRSTFTIPSNFAEGRDPFYPNARYMFGESRVVAQVRVTPGIDLLHLDGISGAADHKLAMINFRTMAAGETNDVLTVSGRVRIRCVEIKSQSVVIEVIGGERRELRLRD